MSTTAVLTGRDNNAYDKVPYISFPYPGSHPDRMATFSTLFGMHPAPVTNCRVLELGCAGGGNLVPLAYQYPQSEFVGIDLSKRQIDMGTEMVSALGLKNIELKQLNIKEVDEGIGKFDYIIVHGIYSWVPDDVKEAIFKVCKTSMGPNGVAYISYNVLPGWHFRGIIRDMMLYHTAPLSDPELKAQQARAIIDFLVDSVPEVNAYGKMLRQEITTIRNAKDDYLLHDHLEETNTPVYFYQFMQRASEHGLQFLAEADFGGMIPGNLSPEISSTLARISTEIIHTEQYIDFLRNRFFRMTLLCHSDMKLNRVLGPTSVKPFYISSQARPANENMDLSTNQREEFNLPNNMTISAQNPLTKAALKYLYNICPQSIRFDDLYLASSAMLSGPILKSAHTIELEKEALATDILDLFSKNLITLRSSKANFVTGISMRPKASDLARYLAKHGLSVTNQLHEFNTIDVFTQNLIQLCDGINSKGEIRENLVALVKSGALNLHRDGKLITEEDEIRNTLTPFIENGLTNLSKHALLIETT